MTTDDPLPQSTGKPSAKQTLLFTRLIWAGLLLGQVVFFCVVLAIRQFTPESEETVKILSFVAIGLIIAAAPAGYVIRNLIYGPRQPNGGVAPGRYATGNIVFFALLEGSSLMGLVVFLLGGTLGLVAACIGMAIQAINFPTGSAMGIEI